MKILHRCCSRTGDRLRKFGLRKETAVLLCPQGFLHRPGHDHEDEDHDKYDHEDKDHDDDYDEYDHEDGVRTEYLRNEYL